MIHKKSDRNIFFIRIEAEYWLKLLHAVSCMDVINSKLTNLCCLWIEQHMHMIRFCNFKDIFMCALNIQKIETWIKSFRGGCLMFTPSKWMLRNPARFICMNECANKYSFILAKIHRTHIAHTRQLLKVFYAFYILLWAVFEIDA